MRINARDLINNPGTFHLLHVRVPHLKPSPTLFPLPLPSRRAAFLCSPPPSPNLSLIREFAAEDACRSGISIDTTIETIFPERRMYSSCIITVYNVLRANVGQTVPRCYRRNLTIESSRGKRERERGERERERERDFHNSEEKEGFHEGCTREGKTVGWERRKERKGGGAVFWYSRRDSLEGIRVLFFAEKRNFAYLAGCRQGLDVNRLISVHESSRGGREARARNYLFASGFTRAPKEARSRSRAREPRELTSNNEAALFAPYPLLEIPFSSSANRKRNRCFGKRDSGNDAPSSS